MVHNFRFYSKITKLSISVFKPKMALFQDIDSQYVDVIGDEVALALQRIENEFQQRFHHRHECGFNSALDDIRLADEECRARDKIRKRRNWLWYLMKTKQYATLDLELGTDFTLHYRTRVEVEMNRRALQSFKDRRRRYSDPVRFSQCNLPIDDDLDIVDLNAVDEYLHQEADPVIHRLHHHLVNRVKRVERHVMGYDVTPLDCKTADHKIPDDRDYSRLSMIAINLRYVIETLEETRKICISKLKNLRMFSSGKTVEEIELDVMKQHAEEIEFQGYGYQTPVDGAKYAKHHKLIKKSTNKPKCCDYCPTIVCMMCFKGEGCCEHIKIKYQGNVEQDVGGDTGVVQVNKAHNVVLTETEITQSDRTALQNPGWSKLSSSDTISSMSSLVDRWFRVRTLTWSVTQLRNTQLAAISLPHDAIFQDPTTCDQPNQIPFRIHRYWRGDMLIKIHVNCNKFQIGQLQCAWYYQPKADASFSTKSSVFTRSGTHHCIISAAPNNEVELRVPFKAFKSMYHTKSFSGDGKDGPLDMGTLYVTVLSPLRTTGETSPKCSLTVFVKFENNEFTGMMSGGIDAPIQSKIEYQMDAIGSLVQTAVPLVEKLLTSSSNDPNRDNPPDNRPPNYFIPTASHSWSMGTDVSEPLQNLRLSARAQTCHPDADVDEMKIDVLKRKSALLHIFSWSQQDNNGKLLWDIPVNPIPPKDRITKTGAAGSTTLAQYQLTPIGFLSSLYQYWRGSIEYRFDIVASQFHSGKLLLAYIPGVAEGASVTLEQARASPNIVISLDNAMSYTWRVPYVADVPWWPRRYAGESISNNHRSPSKIFVFVLNELVLAETVPDSLEILVYMSGGDDMEFSVPVQPSIGLGYDNHYISKRDNTNVYAITPTDSSYVGTWHRTPEAMVMRRAATSEAVAQFSEPILDRPVYYTLDSSPPRAICYPNQSTLSDVTLFIMMKPEYYSGYLAFPVAGAIAPGSVNQERIELIARTAFANNYVHGPWMEQFLATGTASPVESVGFINASLSTTSNTYGGSKSQPFIAHEVAPTLNDLHFQGNREETLALVDNTQMLASTGRGQLTFGEAFVDLKDLCRRYQMYGWTTIPKANIERDPGACSFILPVLPQGLELSINTSDKVNQIWNRAREGHIPLIASLYRFYRGSLRIRMIINGSGASRLTVWVQHRPDRLLTRRDIIDCTVVSTAEAVFNHTYGVYMQAVAVNNVVELEIPYYQKANFGLLQQPIVNSSNEWGAYYSLGELSVGFFGSEPSTDIRCTIYYSLADDCRFTTYQGVPPMVIIDDLPEFQGNKTEEVHEHCCKSCKRIYVHSHPHYKKDHGQYDFQCPYADCDMSVEKHPKGNYRHASPKLEYQGIMDYFRKTPKDVGGDIAEGAIDAMEPKIQNLLASFMSGMETQLGDTFSSVKDSLTSLDLQSKLFHVASQFMHALANPTGTTIAISIISILVTLGLITYAVYNTLKDYLVSIWEYIKIKFRVTSNEAQEEVEIAEEASEEAKKVRFQNDSYNNAVTGFLSLVCGGLCTLFGYKNDISYKAPSDALFKNLDKGMRMSNVCFIFFKNVMSVIVDMKAWLITRIYPGFAAAERLMEGRDIIQKWVSYSHNLFDPTVAQNIPYSRDLQSRVLDCYVFGKILRAKALETQYPAVIQIINQTFEKLHKLQTELIAQGIDPNVRKMPFVIYNYGKPEIGKSHITTDICSELCQSQGITTDTDLMCVLNATSKFWDNCDRQPCLVMDDAFNIRKGTMLEDQIANIFNIVSPTVLVPPRAAVEDKGRRYNPEIFVMNSNADFFKTDVCLETALWRRRDILIWTELDPDFIKPGCIHCEKKLKVNASLPKEVIAHLKDNHHLKFKYTFDVTNSDCSYLPSERWLKYSEILVILKDLFAKNRAAENLKFANRIAYSNAVVGTRDALVENVDNLETLWNDAIAARRLREETFREATFKSIVKGFHNKALQEWKEAKHSALKKIHEIINPTNNKYLLMNHECVQCVRLRYQCAVCKMKLFETIHGSPEPSTSGSASSISVIDDDKMNFQNDNEGRLERFQARFELNEDALSWYNSLPSQYNTLIIENFNTFLVNHLAQLTVALRRYPVYARSKSVFMQLCESIPECCHNISYNSPFLYGDTLAFINAPSLNGCDIIKDLNCDVCYMVLPWKLRDTAKWCLDRHADKREEWMFPFVNVTVNHALFEDIFSKMTKWVYDFYYEKMVPKAKVVFAMFNSLSGVVWILTFMSMVLGIAATGVGVYYTVKHDGGPPPRTSETSGIAHYNRSYQSNSYEAHAKPIKAGKARVKKPTRVSSKVEYQSAQQFNVVEDRLRVNTCGIVATHIDDGRVRRVTSYGVMLKDQQMLIQKHYYDCWRRLDSSAQFYFNNGKDYPTPFGIPLHNFFELEVDWYYDPQLEYLDSNFGVIHLPRTVPAYKDITKFIATSADHQYIKSDSVYLFNAETKRAMHCNMYIQKDNEITDGDTWLRLDSCYAYKYTKIGLCGSVLLCSTLERPIIGIHFAGSHYEGYSEPICQEFFADVSKGYDFPVHDMRMEDVENAKIEFDTMLYPQGTVPKELAHHQGSVSQYVPSLIHGVVEVDTEPNPLSASDERLPKGNPPLKRGCEHMGKPPLDFERDLLSRAGADLTQMILNKVKPVRQKISKLSYEDAICGNPNVDGFRPLDWSKSEGFPLSSMRPKGVRGKRWLFELKEESNGYKLLGMHGELKRQLHLAENLRKQGKRVPTLFVDCLKDTCIDKAKCSIPGKTRIFSMSPVQYTIAFKQYFNDFLASYQECRIDSEHGIGINVDSLEWTKIAEYITRYSKHIVAGDYKNFGPSLMLACVEKAFDSILAWYERYDPDVERMLIRRVLLSEMLHAKHLCLNLVYGVPCGIPSGSPITTPLNSLVNSLYLRCAWLDITGKDFTEMHGNIKILTYGDDVCINVSDAYVDIYNTVTLNKFFAKYNIVFTDIDKSDNIVPYRSLSNTTFLKRGFKKHPVLSSIFLAEIDEQSIRKCINWMTRKGDPLLNTLECCTQACELAFGHGPGYYGKLREVLSHECVKKLGVSFEAPSWYEKSERCYNM